MEDDMYLFYLTLKTTNGLIAVGIFLYTIILAILSPTLKRKEKYGLVRIMSVIPAIVAVIHFAVYGLICLNHFIFLYLEALIPLIFLYSGKKPKLRVLKSVITSVLASVVCIIFLVNAIGSPMVHNYTRMSYTKSFKNMLDTLEKEYCLSSWKRIDYDALYEEYLPRVEEAERNNDEVEYAAVITEVTYKFYDSHTYAYFTPDMKLDTCEYMAGNDYGLSMIRVDDGSIIAVSIEPDCEANKQGIHDGTTITAWDNQDIEEAVAETECCFPGFSFPVEENEDVFRPMFLAGKGGESVDITFINDEGVEQTISVKSIDNYYNRLADTYEKLSHLDMEWRNYYSCMLDDKCGYIQMISESYDAIGDNVAAVKNGYYPKLTEYYADMIKDLENQGMEYLIIDIRNNGGGYDCVAGALASLFTDEKRHMVSFGFEDIEGYHVCEDQYIFPDGRYKDLPVVVLVNSQCMSAGDGMAKFLGDCDNVTLMGITSSSGVNQNNGGYIYLTENIMVCYPVFLSLAENGTPLIDTDYTRENNIPIDVKIPITRENAKVLFGEKNRDFELEFALEYLRKSR